MTHRRIERISARSVEVLRHRVETGAHNPVVEDDLVSVADFRLLLAENERLRAAIFNTINDLKHKKPNLPAIRSYLSGVYNHRADEQRPIGEKDADQV